MFTCEHGGPCSGKCVDLALLVLRVVAAAIFIFHGYGKLFGAPGIEGVTGFFGSLGVPAAGIAAWVVALLEFAGGIGLLLGILVRPLAALFAIEMATAFFLVSRALPKGDLELALFGISLALALAGGGAFALMRGKSKAMHNGKEMAG